jgi:hypothetical protein
MKFGTGSHCLLFYSRGRLDIPRSFGRPFQKPRCPPAGVSFGARYDVAQSVARRTRAAKHLAADRGTLNYQPAHRKTADAAAMCCGTKQYRWAFIGCDRRKLVTRHTVPHFAYAAEYWRRHNAITRPGQSEREGPLAPGVALVMILLLSLGLWCVIWLGVSSLASALPS